VTGIFAVPPPFIGQQMDAVLTDIGTDAVKIGMLHSPEVIFTVARHLEKCQCTNIVLDPVMVAKSGDNPLQEDALAALKQALIPMADIITPNLPEASVLLGRDMDIPGAVKSAKAYITGALAAGADFSIGKGHGPVHHFFNHWPGSGNTNLPGNDWV